MSWTAVPRPPESPLNRFWSSTLFPLSNCWSWSFDRLFSQPWQFRVIGLIFLKGWFLTVGLVRPDEILLNKATSAAIVVTLGELGMFDSMFDGVLRARSTGPSLGGASLMVARRWRQLFAQWSSLLARAGQGEQRSNSSILWALRISQRSGEGRSVP